MDQDSSREFFALCQRHPYMLDFHRSPSMEQLLNFRNELHNLKGIGKRIAHRTVGEQLRALEKAYCEAEGPSTEHKALERRVRLSLRLAHLFLTHSADKDIYLRNKTVPAAKGALKGLTHAKAHIEELLDDEIFLQAHRSSDTVQRLTHLEQSLSSAKELLEELQRVRARYPVIKHSKTQDGEPGGGLVRQLCDRLADACFRFYARCPDTVLHALLVHWKGVDLDSKTVSRIRKEALDRKVGEIPAALQESVEQEWRFFSQLASSQSHRVQTVPLERIPYPCWMFEVASAP